MHSQQSSQLCQTTVLAGSKKYNLICIPPASRHITAFDDNTSQALFLTTHHSPPKHDNNKSDNDSDNDNDNDNEGWTQVRDASCVSSHVCFFISLFLFFYY